MPREGFKFSGTGFQSEREEKKVLKNAFEALVLIWIYTNSGTLLIQQKIRAALSRFAPGDQRHSLQRPLLLFIPRRAKGGKQTIGTLLPKSCTQVPSAAVCLGAGHPLPLVPQPRDAWIPLICPIFFQAPSCSHFRKPPLPARLQPPCPALCTKFIECHHGTTHPLSRFIQKNIHDGGEPSFWEPEVYRIWGTHSLRK